MALAAVESFQGGIEILVTAVSILGGLMAFYSGLEAFDCVRTRRSLTRTADRINKGLARGFVVGVPVSVVVSATLLLI